MTLSRKGVVRLAAALLSVLIVVWLAFGERGLIHLYHMEKQRQRYQERIQSLEKQNHELMLEIERLRTDEAYIESVARKELNLVKDNETRFHFVDPSRGGVTNQAPSPGRREGDGSAAPKSGPN